MKTKQSRTLIATMMSFLISITASNAACPIVPAAPACPTSGTTVMALNGGSTKLDLGKTYVMTGVSYSASNMDQSGSGSGTTSVYICNGQTITINQINTQSSFTYYVLQGATLNLDGNFNGSTFYIYGTVNYTGAGDFSYQTNGQQVYIGRTGYLNLAGKTLTMNSSGGNLVNEGFIYAGSLKANNGQMCINNSGCTQFDNIEVNDVSSYIVNDNGSGYVNFTKSGSNPGVNQNLTSSSTLNVCSKVATTWNRWNNAAVSYGCTTPNWSCGNPLAISLSFFKVERSESAARVRWGTNLEKNTDYFIIERSNNGSQWEEIGQVKSLGRTSVYSEYSLLDNSPFYGANYYRLTEVEVTGKKTVYAVSLLMISSANLSFYLYPNPSNGNFSVFVGSEFEAYDFEIKDMMGKSYGHYGLHAGKNDLENAVPQGTYFAQLKVGPDRKIQRFIVQ